MSTQVEGRGPCLGPSQAVLRDTPAGPQPHSRHLPSQLPQHPPYLEGPCPTPRLTVFSSYLKLWWAGLWLPHLGLPVPGTG